MRERERGDEGAAEVVVEVPNSPCPAGLAPPRDVVREGECGEEGAAVVAAVDVVVVVVTMVVVVVVVALTVGGCILAKNAACCARFACRALPDDSAAFFNASGRCT